MEINVWTIVGILMVVILFTYITSYNMFGLGDLTQNIINKIKQINVKSKIVVDCPEGIIPDKIDLQDELKIAPQLYTSNGREKPMASSGIGYWVDGQEMNFPNPFFESYCHNGSSKGENIDLVYCKNIGYSKTITTISDEGIIGKTKTTSYLIDLILEKESNRIVNEGGLVFGDFKITTYNVISSKCVK